MSYSSVSFGKTHLVVFPYVPCGELVARIDVRSKKKKKEKEEAKKKRRMNAGIKGGVRKFHKLQKIYSYFSSS